MGWRGLNVPPDPLLNNFSSHYPMWSTMRNQHFNGPKLPGELLGQFGGEALRGRSVRGRNAPSGRKERRKAERAQKKTKRKLGGPKNGQTRHTVDSNTEEEEEEEDFSPPPKAPVEKDSVSKPLKSILKRTTQDNNSEALKQAAYSPTPPSQFSRAIKKKLAEDDSEIAALEKKLGLKKKKLKSFEDDGLDDLLGDLDSGDESSEGNTSKRKRPIDDEWLAIKRQKAQGKVVKATEFRGSDSEIEGQSDLEDAEAESKDDLEDTEDDLSDGFDDIGFPELKEPVKPRVRENPYVAPASSTSLPTAKYIPPSLRTPPSSEGGFLLRLRRQIQGLLNRLSEANLLSILRDVEQLYQTSPRGYVSSTIIDLLLGLLSDETSLMDTFLILHASFITAIYKVIGTDFGAQIVERIVCEFDRNYENEQSTGSGSKRASNLISLIAELYNFQVIGSNLVFDYIRVFLEELSDLNTELLLRITKISGSQLRQDDPSSLKDIVILLQKSVAMIGESNLPIRTKFMIESINNLKNNRVKTGVNAATVVSEHTIRMKKTLGLLNNRSIKATEPLRVGLNDIRDTEKKGKWWLVGASWRNDSVQQEYHKLNDLDERTSSMAISSEYPEGTIDILQLAKEQRMNTDIRRAIFITIMSATDYKDAYLRLLKLKLKKSQELEMPRVLIHCAGCERSYNPYYTLIARRLCSDRKLKMAFQFALWDIFKQLGEKSDGNDILDEEGEDWEEGLSARKIVNLGRMYGNLIASGGLSVTCLKTLNFAYLQPKTKTFVEILVVTIILQSQKSSGNRDEKSLLNIFRAVEEAPQMIRGLQYFVKKVVSKADIAGDKSERETVRWASDKVTELMTNSATAELLE